MMSSGSKSVSQETYRVAGMLPSMTKEVEASASQTAISRKGNRGYVRKHREPFLPELNPFSIAGRKRSPDSWTTGPYADDVWRQPDRSPRRSLDTHRHSSEDLYTSSVPPRVSRISTMRETGAQTQRIRQTAPTQPSSQEPTRRTGRGRPLPVPTEAPQHKIFAEVDRREATERREREAEAQRLASQSRKKSEKAKPF